MTQKDKQELPDFLESNSDKDSGNKEKLEFSFFDDLPDTPSSNPFASLESAEAEKQPQKASIDNDFFSFDEHDLAGSSKPVEDNSQSDISFDDDMPEPDGLTSQASSQGIDEPVKAFAVQQTMRFSCLKCSAANDVEKPPQNDSELNVVCCSCSAKIRIVIEANTRRATQKSREIFCSNCGHSLDHHVYCPNCGLYCPDYYAVENPAEVQRKAKTARENSFKNIFSNLTWSHRKRKESEKHHKPVAASHKTGGKLALGSKQIQIIAGASALVICLLLTSFLYLKYKNEQQYTKNYVKAIYAIHVGSNVLIGGMNKTAKDWQISRSSGAVNVPANDSGVTSRTSKVNQEIAKLMQQLQHKVPKKFEQPNNKLVAYLGDFDELQKVKTSDYTTPEQLAAMAKEFENKLSKKRSDIKSGMDNALRSEYDAAKKKFRGFDTF